MQIARPPLRQVRRALLVTSALSACIGMLMLVVPAFALQLLETALPSGSWQMLAVLCGIAAACLLVAAALDFSRELVLLRAGVWIEHTLAARLVESGLSRGDDGETIRARTDAVERLRAALTGGALPALLDLPMAVTACLLVYFLHPILALACTTALAAHVLCLLVLARASADAHDNTVIAPRRWLETVTRLAGRFGADGQSAGLADRWQQANRRRVAADYRNGRRHGLARAIARAIEPAGIIAVAAVGGTLVVSDGLLPGAVVAAMLIVSRALAALGATVTGWDRLSAAYRSWRLLAGTDPQVSSTTGMVGAGHIVLDGVTCLHPGQREPAIAGIRLSLAPGESIGIIGPHGAGKSTLAAIIAGVLEPASGNAVIDGVPIAFVQRTSAERIIGYMPDEPRLAGGTVLDCITGFAADDEADAVRAAVRAGVHDAIAALPNGYETPVGVDGLGLPMRARRAVALARAAYRSPRVIVLDEPELGLDEHALSRLVGVLGALRRDGIGLVMATAEPRLLRLTDRIVLMSKGGIEAILPSAEVVGANDPSRPPPPRAFVRQVA